MPIMVFFALVIFVSFMTGRKTESFVRRRKYLKRQSKSWLNNVSMELEFTVGFAILLIGIMALVFAALS